MANGPAGLAHSRASSSAFFAANSASVTKPLSRKEASVSIAAPISAAVVTTPDDDGAGGWGTGGRTGGCAAGGGTAATGGVCDGAADAGSAGRGAGCAAGTRGVVAGTGFPAAGAATEDPSADGSGAAGDGAAGDGAAGDGAPPLTTGSVSTVKVPCWLENSSEPRLPCCC